MKDRFLFVFLCLKVDGGDDVLQELPINCAAQLTEVVQQRGKLFQHFRSIAQYNCHFILYDYLQGRTYKSTLIDGSIPS